MNKNSFIRTKHLKCSFPFRSKYFAFNKISTRWTTSIPHEYRNSTSVFVFFCKYVRFIIILLLLAGVSRAQNKIVPFNDPDISYEGRIVFRTDAAELSWPGTTATIQFEGTTVSATLQDLDTADYYNVIVDNHVVSMFHSEMVKKSYLLASGLSEGKHEVQLFKRTEWDKGETLFFGFELPKEARLIPPAKFKKRKIEFYGNSITCGYADEDSTGQDRWYGYFENNYVAYGAITARYFDAQYSCISKGGIGVMVSWFPLIMPEMYNRADATDPNSIWDFSNYTPDIVVINLFQNDSWLVNMPDHEQFKNKFGNKAPDEVTIIAAYKNFVTSIRNKYPQATIICTLGSMDATCENSPWPGYIQQAVDQMQDKNIYSHFFPFKNSNGHPNVAEQKIMADDLIKFIETNIKW